MKTVGFPHIACVQAIVSMLLLSSCGGGGNSTQGALAEDDCTSSTNLSTQLEFEVDINGNISAVPMANNSVSGCGSSSGPDGTIELTDSVATEFRSSDNFDVWECDTGSGANIFYALMDVPDTSSSVFRMTGLEIGPVDSPQPVSQLVFWDPVNADTLLLSVPEQGTEIEWSNIRFPSADSMNLDSATRGTLQCTRKTINGNNNDDGLFGFNVLVSSLTADSDGTVELTESIETDYSSPSNLQYWSCPTAGGSILNYAFFEDREFPSAPNISVNRFANYGIHWPSGPDYFWKATSADSIQLDLIAQGIKIELTDIGLPASNHCKAKSTNDGALNCFLASTDNLSYNYFSLDIGYINCGCYLLTASASNCNNPASAAPGFSFTMRLPT